MVDEGVRWKIEAKNGNQRLKQEIYAKKEKKCNDSFDWWDDLTTTKINLTFVYIKKILNYRTIY